MAPPSTQPAPLATSTIFVSSETSAQSTSSHKRTYQACIPCRRRKVRCDLGPVDNPHPPPCVRCRRESKECYFSATRRKRKLESEEDFSGGDNEVDGYVARNRRKSSRTSPIAQHSLNTTIPANSLSTTPSLDRYNRQTHEPRDADPYYTDPAGNDEPEQDQEVTNETAAALFQTPINTPGDALHLLLEASGRSEDFQLQDQQGQNVHEYSQERKAVHDFTRPRSKSIESPLDHVHNPSLDPAIISNRLTRIENLSEELIIWSRLRFVRAGWLTAREALSYIHYFYEFLSPLTPINPPDFRLSAHLNIDEESILTVTVLTIASRYKKLEGLGGQTRSFMIHDRLWRYLQNMITRMFWGQEQFGGGFCGAGSKRSVQKSMEKGGLRSLGTIESLLLLSEFHPRSMHFPPSDDAEGIFAITDGDGIEEQGELAIGDSTFAGWTEPALRSDRMCWSLIGTAYSLAYELGVFGNYTDGTRDLEGGVKHRSGSSDYCQRADRIERLLYIYVNQTSGRLGFPSAFPGYLGDTDLANIKRTFTGNQAVSRDSVETIQQSWAEITSIMKACNATLFSSKEKTTRLIQSGEYIGFLQQLQPILAAWYHKIQASDVPKYSKIILLIEYEYARVYINSLALQAVLEQWTANASADYSQDSVTSLAGSYQKNEYYIKEVVDASRNLLRCVVKGLFPDDRLKHAPVRTHMRILSGAMFLLKTFALGAKVDEVATSLHLLDGTIKALRTSVVDDVHLCLRIADLLEGLTSSIRHKFVRLTAPNTRTLSRQNIGNAPGPSGSTSFYYSRNSSMQDPLAGISTDRVDPRDNAITIMPPRDNIAYMVPSTQYSDTPVSATSGIDFLNDDWLTLNLQPLLPDTAGSLAADPNDWFGNFGPEIRDNLEVLGKLVSDQF